jgi:hypothetical protein
MPKGTSDLIDFKAVSLKYTGIETFSQTNFIACSPREKMLWLYSMPIRLRFIEHATSL